MWGRNIINKIAFMNEWIHEIVCMNQWFLWMSCFPAPRKKRGRSAEGCGSPPRKGIISAEAGVRNKLQPPYIYIYIYIYIYCKGLAACAADPEQPSPSRSNATYMQALSYEPRMQGIENMFAVFLNTENRVRLTAYCQHFRSSIW